MGHLGYKNRNFMKILINKTYISNKMHLKGIIYKITEFFAKKWQSTKIMHFAKNSFRCFFCKSLSVVWDLHKSTDFFIPIKTYFEQKTLDLLRGYCNFLKTKISITMRILKIELSAYSTLVVDF